ncbi:MAG: hypothetical protein RIR58_449, partial [Actinomycetota bacterium]
MGHKLGTVVLFLLTQTRLWHGRQVTRENAQMDSQMEARARILVVDNYDSFV